MHQFCYRNGVLNAEQVSLAMIAEAVGTPFYCYSSATIEQQYRAFAAAFAEVPSLICYALKANSNQAVIATLARLGAGADVVSEGELKRALAAGIANRQIVFSGVGKSERELALAVDTGVYCINVESEPELERVSAIATAKGRTVDIALRVNPDVDAKTHEKIATGRAEDKFGIPLCRARESYARAAQLPALRITGVDMHIGSQITELAPFERAFARLAELVVALRADGHRIEHLDLGGGLGIAYRDGEAPPALEAYAELVKSATRELDCQLIFEPGRLLVGNAGVLVTRVLYCKAGLRKTFIVVDAGMNDLIRPTLYDAAHEIRQVAQPTSRPTILADVVGPVCESGDFLARQCELCEPQPGELLAVMATGAYGAVEASTYNSRALVPEVLVNNSQWALVRPRLTVEDIIGWDRLPPWL